jgi:CYTH domain-containing protein
MQTATLPEKLKVVKSIYLHETNGWTTDFVNDEDSNGFIEAGSILTFEPTGDDTLDIRILEYRLNDTVDTVDFYEDELEGFIQNGVMQIVDVNERERKYILLQQNFNHADFDTSYKITQGYLVIEENKHVRVRLYHENRVAEITYKVVLDSTDRQEFTIAIDFNLAEKLLSTTETKLTKTRFSKEIIDSENNKINVDVDFYEDGLAIVELEHTTDKLTIDLPEYCGCDVTGHEQYTNVNLAKRKIKQ